MEKIRVTLAAASLNQLPMDWSGNFNNILEGLKSAQDAGIDLVCFPELSIPGYGCEDMFFAEFIWQSSLERLQALIPLTKNIICAVGLPLKFEEKLYNAIAVIANGALLGFVCKHILAKQGVYYEPRWFTPWKIGESSSINLWDNEYPIGDIIFNLSGVRIGLEICEDAWAPQRVAEHLAKVGVDIVLNPSASHFAFAKEIKRIELVTEGSDLCQSVYVYSNHLGNDAGRLIYDGSRIIAQNGKLLTQGKRFTFKSSELTSAVVEILPKISPISLMREVRSEFAWGDKALITSLSSSVSIQNLTKEEELYKSVSLGLFDYMRKSRSKGFVISLSGGVDSAAVASLAVASFKEAYQQLGLKALKDKLSYWPEIQAVTSIEQLLSLAVVCAYQSTANSGAITNAAAKSLAIELGCSFLELKLSGLVEDYLGLLKQNPDQVAAAGLPASLSWEANDISLQNIQARTRGPGIWLIANLKNALLLTTSNRSEASVGYTTMDGDTCGGLGPIAGVDKAYLRKWLVWFEEIGPDSSGPIKSLKLVNQQEPTAELRPPGNHQTDEADLMPYEILDQIERFAIRDKLSPQVVLDQVARDFSNYSRDQLIIWIKRFHRLWSQNQWKRERYAPSFHLDDQSVDPKTWCRFPILSSGYSEELSLLS